MGKDTKAAIKAPCAFASGKDTKYPSVNCLYDCINCGWNPAEKKRRLSEGTWEDVYTRLNEETGKKVTLEGVKQLRFERGVYHVADRNEY